MTRIKLDDQFFETQPSETVLNTLLRYDKHVPYGCKAGVCQSCLMRCLDETPAPTSAQIGLKDTQQKQNYFLPCICIPEKDMSVMLPNMHEHWINAQVVDKCALSDNVIQLTLESKEPLNFFAGQFVNLRNKAGVIRSYSLANTPTVQQTLVFHIRVLPHGQFSRWVADALDTGMSLEVSPAQGSCHYMEGSTDQPLLLIGTGTGLAPLYGIICDALSHHHGGEIHLFHGSRDATGLYLEDTLNDLASQHPNFHYTPCVSRERGDATHYTQGRANDIALQKFSKLDGWRVYLCGQPDMVAQTKKRAYLQGASLKAIYADAFLS